jgi:outer membrane protein assembly factor BamC
VHYLAKSSLALAIVLNGCSLFTAESKLDSNSNEAVSELKVPSGLQQPAKPGQYDIPNSKHPDTMVSERSPTLILATAASSRVDEGEKQARVRFDRTEVTGDLIPFLQQMLQKQFTEQNISLTAVDQDELIYTTDWINTNQEQGFWFWSSTSLVDRARFTITLDPKPHGRSANLTVKMLEHEYFSPSAKLTDNDSHRQEVDLLNSIIDRIGKEEVIITQQNRNKIPDVNLEPGLDKAGNAVLITPQTIDVTWSQLETLFAALNLNVTDRDRSKYTYFLRYEKTKPGFWSSLWSSKTVPVLPLSAGEYQLVLAKHEMGTAITVKDNEGNALSAETILSLHQPFVEAIQITKIEL